MLIKSSPKNRWVKRQRVYVSVKDLDKTYRVNRETLLQVLRMYYVGGKLLNGIKSMSMHANSLACVTEKWGENLNWCGTRLYHVPFALQCIYECCDERDEDGENGSEIT